jgi:hypothetical protein
LIRTGPDETVYAQKDIHRHTHVWPNFSALIGFMSAYDDSAHWHGRAKEMLARAEQMNECATKHVLRRMAETYEDLARKADKQVNRLPRKPVSKTSLPAVVRESSARKDLLVACVKQMDEYATELVLRRVADACECLARTAEQRSPISGRS